MHYYDEFARKEDMLVEIDARLGMGVRNGNKEKKKAYEGEDPEPLDPGDKGAKSLGWMRKRGSIRPFALCEDYSRSIGLDLEGFAKEMGREHIIIGGTGNGEIAVKLVNKNWAAKWARKYGYELPHHSQTKKLEEIKL